MSRLGSWIFLLALCPFTTMLVVSEPARADSVVVMSEKLPWGRDQTSAVWTGTHALIFGADDVSGDEILSYHPETGAVVTLGTSLPTWRGDTSAVWTGAMAIVFGGWNGGDEILRYTFANNQLLQLTTTATLPLDMFATSAAWDPTVGPGCPQGCAYIFGGRDTGASGQPALDSVLRYDPVGDVVTWMTTLPAANAYTSAIRASNAHIYIFGGWVDNSIVRYTPATNTATLLAPLPDDVYLTSASYDGSRFTYVAGGEDGSSLSNKIYRFDTLTEVATPMPTTLPTARSGTSAVWANGNMHIFGGRDPSHLDQIVRYNPELTVPVTGVKSCDTYNAIYGNPYPNHVGIVVEREPPGPGGDIAVCVAPVVGAPCPAGQPGLLVNNSPVCGINPCTGPTDPGTLALCGVGPLCPSGIVGSPGPGEVAVVCEVAFSACTPNPGPGWTVGLNGSCFTPPWVAPGGASPCPSTATVNVRIYWGIVSGTFDVCV